MDVNVSRGTLALDHSLVEASVSCKSCWERLPAEIMEDIFFLCQPLEKNRLPCNTHAPYLLTYICRSWYKIVAGFPKMWSTVVLTTANDSDTIPPSRLEAGARHLAMCITRSKAAPRELYVRAEFIAYPASFEHIQCVEWQQLVLVYPVAPYPLPPFFPLPVWMIMPNLTVLEVHSQFSISHSDQVVLSGIIDSAQALKRYISPKNGAMSIPGQLSLPNMSNLEVLTLQELIPISACSSILQSAPSLRKLSLTVGITSDVGPNCGGIELLYTSTHTSTQPFIHPHLEYLALAHFKCDLSALFECITLPLLQFLVLDFCARGSTAQALWPHENFVTFLRRSGCKLKSFHILDQPIPSSRLLELLRLPQLADLLEYLGIQHYVGEELVIDDSVLEELTLPSSILKGEITPTLDSKMVHTRSSPPVLCPNIERLIMFVPPEGFTLSKLIAMFNSRLPFNTLSVLSHKPLRQVEMDLYEEMNAEFGSLRKNGLVLTLFEPESSTSMPLDRKQKRLWRRHLSEGLDDEVYDYVTGTWRPSDITLTMS